MLAQKQMTDGRPAARDEALSVALRHHASGRLDDAAQLYQQLHAADPRDSEVLFLMGVLCCDLGLFDPACRFLEEALDLARVFPEAGRQLVVALTGLAEANLSAARLTEARRNLDRALELSPSDAPVQQSLGRLALLEGDVAAAEARFVASLAQRPDHAQTLNWLGLARLQLEKYADAEAALRQALRLDPGLNQARNNLGLALYSQERLADAMLFFQAALARDPTYAKARINLALTLRLLGRHAEARVELEAVLAQHPEDVDALNNLGVIFQDLGEAELALRQLTQATALAPESQSARWNLALTQLQLGDFSNGWTNFEARWEGCAHLRDGYMLPSDRAWRGEPLHGKRLLLWAEQGLGDTLQFIRFADDVARRGATVSVLAPAEIADLVRSAPGVSAAFVELPAAALPYDVHCPLMSLPYHLRITADTEALHGAIPYLFAPRERSARWRERLGAHSGIKVGIVWAGNARRQRLDLMAVDQRRSIALSRFAPILEVAGCSFFSLQKGDAADQLAASAFRRVPGRTGGSGTLEDYSAEWSDFTDTAAFVDNLDLVITVDTAVAHLAGALGRPVWLLNRYDTCWRWMRGRDDSPWYTTLRQFRQPRPGEWDPVIRAAAAALCELAAAAAAA
jgi:tetratricopeptide (TPR) repeat protein